MITLEIPLQAYELIMQTLEMDAVSSSIPYDIRKELREAVDSIVELDQEPNDDFRLHIHSQECHDLENTYALNGACSFKELTYALAADLAQRDIELAEAIQMFLELQSKGFLNKNHYKGDSDSTDNNGDETQ